MLPLGKMENNEQCRPHNSRDGDVVYDYVVLVIMAVVPLIISLFFTLGDVIMKKLDTFVVRRLTRTSKRINRRLFSESKDNVPELAQNFLTGKVPRRHLQRHLRPISQGKHGKVYEERVSKPIENVPELAQKFLTGKVSLRRLQQHLWIIFQSNHRKVDEKRLLDAVDLVRLVGSELDTSTSDVGRDEAKKRRELMDTICHVLSVVLKNKPSLELEQSIRDLLDSRELGWRLP